MKIKMASSVIILVASVLGSTLAQNGPYPANFYPTDHHPALVALKKSFSDENFDYTIIPKEEYPVVEYESLPQYVSMLDVIYEPIAVIGKVASGALAVVKYLVSKSVFLFLGGAIVIGFCALTPYCTLTVEEPLSRAYRSVSDSYPYLEYAENLLNKAYSLFGDV